MQLKKASALLIALAIPGCAAWSTPPPGTSIQLEELPRVDNSRDSPCWQQKQVAAQNSYVDTIKTKKDAVYKAPCEVEKKIARAKS